MDNNKDSNVIDARIDYFILQATTQVNGRLSLSAYTIPFEEPYPEEISHLTALLTGVLIYNGRRIVTDETENQVSAQEQEIEKMIARIQSDTYTIPGLTRLSTKPIKVVKEPASDLDGESAFHTPCRAAYKY